ncbi:MAG: GNAT family N-acetyltransferase [Planctomycetaceae bacterium]
MHIQLKKPGDLTTAELQIWRGITAGQPEFSSPYFHPQFTLDAAAVRNDVEIAVLREGDRTVGFFPFQRSGTAARPVGGQLSDAHGVIAGPDVVWTWPDLIQQCGLTVWDYHYQIESQIPSSDWRPEVSPSAVMNLEGGWDAYRVRVSSKSLFQQTDNKARRIERDHGPLRFEWNCRDEGVFEQLLSWKSDQYRESAIADVFAVPWTSQLLKQVWTHSGSDYEGLLNAMYAGDRLAAVHFGLRAGRVMHYWFPAYDPALQAYSPGTIHLLTETRQAIERGVERYDLGKLVPYKSRVCTQCVDVASGSIDLRPVTRILKYGYHQTFEWLRHSPLRSVARIPGRMLRRLAEQQQLQ